MNKNFSKIISVVVSVLLIFCLVEITALKDEISRLRSSLDFEMNQVNNTVYNLYSEVQQMLAEEENQLTTADYHYGNIDIDSKTAELICTIVPKTYTPGITQVSLSGNNREWPLSYENNQYTAVIELPLFDHSEITQVTLNDNGTIRTQTLDWALDPRYETLLMSYVSMYGSASFKSVKDECIWSPRFTAQIDLEQKGDFQIQSIELVEILDGEELARTPVDLSFEGQQAYAKASAKYNESLTVPENLAENTDFNGFAHFLYFLDKDYHIPNGSTLELYVDVVDGNGLRYRSFAECHAITADGKRDDSISDEKRLYASAEPVLIYDENGTILYQIDSELFPY